MKEKEIMCRRRMALCAFIMIISTALVAGAKEINVRGRLGKTVEAEGWLILTEGQKYLILNPQRFQREKWFREGTEVEATGETKPGTITIFQEGVPFEVRSMKPQSGGGGGAAAAGREGEAAAAAAVATATTRIVVGGDATIEAQPDTATLTIAVVTQAKRALDAQAENARRTEEVVRALRAAAGAGAEVKTSGYSLVPQQNYRENQPPTIVGYEARNSVQVTTSDLQKVGAVIDAAAAAGANNITNLAFTLRRDEEARQEVLARATREALAKAQRLAAALQGRVARVVEVQESGPIARPLMYNAEAGQARLASMSAPTPIEVGALEIRGQVQLVVEVEGARP